MHLAYNDFSGSLPSTTWNIPTIQEIFLNSNTFSGIFPRSIGYASKLATLVIADSSFASPIPTTLGNLPFLKRIFLSDNNFTRESSSPELRFISSLKNCRQFEFVELWLNQFNGYLPRSFGKFSTSLRVFRAFGSKIEGIIPSEIGNLSSL